MSRVRGLGRAEPSQGLEVESGQESRCWRGSGSEVGPGAGPGAGAWTWAESSQRSRCWGPGLGDGPGAGPGPGPGAWTWACRVCIWKLVRTVWSGWAIGCFVYECLEHGLIFMQLLCLVIDLDVGSLYVNFIQVCLWR